MTKSEITRQMGRTAALVALVTLIIGCGSQNSPLGPSQPIEDNNTVTTVPTPHETNPHRMAQLEALGPRAKVALEIADALGASNMGDVDRNGMVTRADIQALAGVLYSGAPVNPILHDINRDGTVDLGDLYALTDLVRVDIDGNGKIQQADIWTLVDAAFSGGPLDEEHGDLNRDGSIDVFDVISLIDIISQLGAIRTLPLAGDFNGNGMIDTGDANMMLAAVHSGADFDFEHYDLNRDGSVDIFDFNILTAALSGKNTAPDGERHIASQTYAGAAN